MNSLHLSKHSTGAVEARNNGLIGLQNIGNTCFLNSIIQCLSNTKPLLQYILKEEYQNDISNQPHCLLMRRYSDLIQTMWGEQKGAALNTRFLKSALTHYTPRFNGSSEQDAQEFLRYLLVGLHEEINQGAQRSTSNQRRVKEIKHNVNASEAWQKYLEQDNSKIVHTFCGLLRSLLRCTVCGFISTVFEPFWDISLSIPADNEDTKFKHKQLTLNDCLDHFVEEEILEGNNKPICSQCKIKQRCGKKILIQYFPQILVVHIKRCSTDGKSNLSKVNTLIDYPIDQLNMSSYCAERRNQQMMYNLYGVVNHSGSCSSGHYTACCKHPYTRKWHLFNDIDVIPINSNEIPKVGAYILFYQKEKTTTDMS